MGFWCIFSLGLSCSAVLNARDDPLEVVYKPGDKLTVELHFTHVPYGYKHYIVKTRNSDAPVSSGLLVNDIKPFSMVLTDIDNHAVLETVLERPGSKHRLVQTLIKLRKSKRRRTKLFHRINVDWRPSDRTGVEIITAFEMQSAPRLIYFKDDAILEFILTWKNLPRHDLFLADINFNTGSSVQDLDNNQNHLSKMMNGLNLTLQMQFITSDCTKKDTLTFIQLIYDEERRHDSTCLGRPCEIILDWENQSLSDIGPLVPSGKAKPPALPKPRMTPDTFVDNGRQFAVFTCQAEGRLRDILSWYQIQGTKTSQLVMTQLRDTNTTKMTLILNKTITTTDRGSWIYCSRRSDDGSVSKIDDLIYLHSSREWPNESLWITVRPASEVAPFHVNTTQSFECGGSQPVDGRSFNWYIEDVPSSNNFSHAPAEKMRSNLWTRNVNLTLDLDESYHLKRIYCVQEYHMALENTTIGYYYWNYGEKIRSNKILLSMVSEDYITDNMKNGSDGTFPTFIIYIFLGVAFVVLATAISLVILRRHRSINRREDNNNDSIYATAEITYAELQLSPESNNIVRREEPTPYAQIIGSCRPKADNHQASPIKLRR